MPNFHIFTMLWGEHHINLFKRACFRSLNWPKNKAFLGPDRPWHIYTKREHFDELTALFKTSGFKLGLLPIEDSMRVAGCGFVPTKQCDAGVVLLNGLRAEMAICLKEGSKVLFAPPDTVFGDGSVESLVKLGSHKLDTCVAVSHPRVLPSVLDEIDILGATRGALTNAQLVTLSLQHAHDSFKLANIHHPKNNSVIGGIAWEEIGIGLYSVQHRLPTHYFCGFNNQDWDFWWGQSSFGAFDHRWPAENLIRQERQRYVGSSDAAFIVEITDYDKNVPPEWEKPPGVQIDLDGYWTNHYHNGINRQFNVIFRGE